MFGFTKAALAVAVLASSAVGQTTFYEAPQQAWAKVFEAMGDNNGIVVSPDDSIVFATSSTGGVAAMKRDDGTILWSLPNDGGFSNGEVTFSPEGETIYYPVSTGETCTVYALTASTGDEVWASSALGGVCQGSVQPTSDGENVYVIYNSDAGTVGHFTVLDNTGADIYTFDDTVGPFSPMGVYAEPSPGGNFLEGTGNTNTLAIWGYTPSPGATTAETGGTFAFQMPVATSVAGPNVTVLIAYPGTTWRSTAPPLLTSMGQQMFWSVSRSQLRSWTAVTFRLGADGGVDFGRGSPLFLAAPYTPAVNDNDDPTIVCGGAANSSFSCMEPTGDPYELSFVNEFAGVVNANPFFSTEGDRVYYVSSPGTFYSVDPTTGAEFWNAPTGVTILANVGMTSDGAYLFFGDTTGNILAWQIADSTLGEVTTPPGAGGGDGAGGESAFPESGAPTTAPMPNGEPSAPTPNGEPSAPTPTSPTTSGAVSTAVFSVIAASAVAAVTFF